MLKTLIKALLPSMLLLTSVDYGLKAQNTYPWPESGNIGINVGSYPVVNKLQIGPNGQGWNGNDMVISNLTGSLAIHNEVGQTYLYGTQAIAIRPGFGKMAIFAHASGYVGIQSTNPQGTLQVSDYRPIIIKPNGNNGVYGSEIGFNAVLNTSVVPNTFRKLGGTSQNGGASIAVDYSGNMLFQMYNGNTEFESITNYAPQVTFLNNGNVGIGTSSPGTKLHLSGSGQEIKFLSGTNTSGYALSIGINDDGINFSNNSSIRGFNFSNQVGTLMRIMSDGNIGIGTASPDSKLSVSGTIHAKEVKVDLNVPGPDYVFDSDYKPASLEETKAYIDRYKHLPEIPSAKEMEANGVNVGEMNILLLKKIEELTLHLIEQDKRIEQLERAVNESAAAGGRGKTK